MASLESRHEELVSPAKISPAIDTVCCTAGYIQSQSMTGSDNNKLHSANVRFVVQPVPEVSVHEGIEEDSSNENSSNHVIHIHHSERDISISSDPALNSVYSSNQDHNLSEDLFCGSYGYMGSDPQAQLTVRSMASIGIGSSDGRKIHLRRVHTTGAESFLSPLITPPGDGIQVPWSASPKIIASGKTLASASSLSEESDCESDLEHVRISRRGRRLHGQLWGSRLEFLLACMGFAVGLGNIWRFPYTAYKSGGGAFLIPYCIMVFLCGIPLQVLELAVGQYTRAGPVDAMKDICPLLSGVGVAMVMLSLFLSSYYSVVMGWAMLYLGSSFTQDLPWTHCNNTWNTDNCRLASAKGNGSASRLNVDNVTLETVNVSDIPAGWHNWSTPGQEFFDRRILQISNGVNESGDLNWEMGACLLVAWILLYFSIRKSVRWSGKAVYLTATLPYVLLLALTARALTMEGAHEGVRHLFYPDWSLLLNAEVWVNALSQTFMSVGVAYGSLIAFASYNRFHNPFISDAFCLSALNSFTSLVTGIIAFAALGHTAVTYNEPIKQTANDGLSFSLVMYTTVVSQMPFPQFWAVLLFLMFICLGLDTQFATIEVILLTLQRFLRLPCCRGCSRLVPDFIAIGVCFVCLVGSLPYISQGGIYLMQLTDYYIVTVGVILLAFIEALSTGIRYGAARLARNVREMTGHSPSPFLVVCWAGVTPMLILGVWIFHMIDLGDLTYNHGSYSFPSWTRTLGWSVVGLLLLPVPALGLVAVYEASGKSIFEKFINSTKTQIKECPCCRRGVTGLKDTHSEVHLNEINNPQVYAKFTLPDDGSYQTITSVQPSHLPIPTQFVVRSDDESEQETFRNPLG